ncbi:hypothetical protein AcW1_001322 [Taiwanofungus camphoratus]|nr:hypothetical protein AcW2_000147 [Antrodia cinnamomea]KAI0937308.1 hypothetical protein AcV5_005248 [Antrodia cinnamomea]KAI0962518.1 hypothetical protein AcV7_001349 [Antrodia cinnamomea]KAI0964518.1 hypothetical protein AcW1_001322 [Antrodia cinnamomea]
MEDVLPESGPPHCVVHCYCLARIAGSSAGEIVPSDEPPRQRRWHLLFCCTIYVSSIYHSAAVYLSTYWIATAAFSTIGSLERSNSNVMIPAIYSKYVFDQMVILISI